MKFLHWLALLCLASSQVLAFSTKKHEPHRPAFRSIAAEKMPASTPFAVAPPMTDVPAEQVEDDVSYSTAIIACTISLALGFGLGYGT